MTLALLKSMNKRRFSLYQEVPILSRHLIKLCERQPDLCTQLFPQIIQDFMSTGDKDGAVIRTVLSRQITSFFAAHFEGAVAASSSLRDSFHHRQAVGGYNKQQVWSLTQLYSIDFSQSTFGGKSAFSTNAQSRFASVVVDGVLGPPRLARHT